MYEFYSRFGEALYVGCSYLFARRLIQHQAQPWWQDVYEIRTTAYPDKRTARVAELDLIHALQPRHNVQGTERAREISRQVHRLRREARGA